MGKGVGMGGAAGWALALGVAALAVAAPVRGEKRLVPDTPTTSELTASSVAPSAADDSKSLKRMVRYGLSLEQMQAIPAMPQHFRFGVPYDDFAWRDDRMNLTANGFLAVGTVLRVQRDFENFRELSGARFFRAESVPGFMITPLSALPVEVGAGMIVSLDKYADNSLLAGRAFFGTLQLGMTF